MAVRDVGNGSAPGQLHSGRRMLAVLEALAARPAGATPKELAQALGLHLSTCYRLLNTLVAAGYAARIGPGGLFRLGRRISYLHQGYVTTLRPPTEILAFLHALQVATGETAMLFHLEGDDVVAAAIVGGSRAGAHPPYYAGIAAPAHTTAAGRALLAWLPAAQVEAYLARLPHAPESPWFPPANPGSLRRELEQIRLVGYAIDRGEGNPDVCCAAAPISARDGVVEAIGTMAPSVRFWREEAATVAVILEIARAIAALQATLPARADAAPASGEETGEALQAAIEKAVATVTVAMSRVG